MTITHQTVIDEEGNPSAAIIPWSVFMEIQDCLEDGTPSPDELEAMNEAERDREEGNHSAFESHESLKARLGIR